MAACGEELITKTGITPTRLKAHYKRCHDGLDPQTAGFRRREIGLCTTLVTGGAQDQLMELFGMRADHALQGVPDGKNGAADHAQDKRRLWRR